MLVYLRDGGGQRVGQSNLDNATFTWKWTQINCIRIFCKHITPFYINYLAFEHAVSWKNVQDDNEETSIQFWHKQKIWFMY